MKKTEVRIKPFNLNEVKNAVTLIGVQGKIQHLKQAFLRYLF